MTDLKCAIQNLDTHSICLCKNGECITEDGRGIAPIMKLIQEGVDLTGYSAADLIVGKAAAMLFVRAGIVAVHGRTLSQSAKEFLEKHHVPYSYDVLVDRIINRNGTDICPMEKMVLEIEDVDLGYIALHNKLMEMKAKKNTF